MSDLLQEMLYTEPAMYVLFNMVFQQQTASERKPMRPPGTLHADQST